MNRIYTLNTKNGTERIPQRILQGMAHRESRPDLGTKKKALRRSRSRQTGTEVNVLGRRRVQEV